MFDDSDEDDQAIFTDVSVDESSAPTLGPIDIYLAIKASVLVTLDI